MHEFPWKSNFQRVKKRSVLGRFLGSSGRADKVYLPGAPAATPEQGVSQGHDGHPARTPRAHGPIRWPPGAPTHLLGDPGGRPRLRTVGSWVPRSQRSSRGASATGAAGRGGAGRGGAGRSRVCASRTPDLRRRQRPLAVCLATVPIASASVQNFRFRL